MSRRPPPDADARRARILSHGFVPGMRVIDMDVGAFATVLRVTAKNMVVIEHEDPKTRLLHGVTRTVNPYRLNRETDESTMREYDEGHGP